MRVIVLLLSFFLAGTVLAVLLIGATLIGCRDEDGRALGFNKGKYGGPPIGSPSQQAVKGWNDHAEKMRF